MRPERESNHSPSSAEVKNMWNNTSIPAYFFMAWYSKHKDNIKSHLTPKILFYRFSKRVFSKNKSILSNYVGYLLSHEMEKSYLKTTGLSNEIFKAPKTRNTLD
jgi:hypothetical protein